jgi:tRNA (mo5U34)-methyltransferase
MPPLDAETLRAKVAAFPYWYHKIDLPHGVVTPGWAPIDPLPYQVPDDLSGKRVLDVGTWDGYWTFEALRRGAREVVAIDDFSDALGELGPSDRKAWGTFDLCREALGYDDSRCSRHEMTVYNATPEKLGGRFDVIFFFGTLYHLRHPLLALDALANLCEPGGIIYAESAVCDDFSPYRGGMGHGYPGKQMVMEFYPTNEYGNNASNWWAPTVQCMMYLLGAAGFTEDIQSWKIENPWEPSLCRGYARARKPARD